MSNDAAVRRVIAEQLGVSLDQVTPETKLAADLGADSLDQVDVAMAIEDELGIELDDDGCAKCVTVSDWVRFADSKTAAQQAG